MGDLVQAKKLMTISIDCPCCDEQLYTTTHPGGRYSTEMPGQKLYWRYDKCFMKCRHCQCEVLMEGAGYMYPSPMQLGRLKRWVSTSNSPRQQAF